MKLQDAINRLIDGQEIMHEDMLDVMGQIMRGDVSETLISAFIIGLRVKGETVGEITAAARVMRQLSTKVMVSDNSYMVDTCGTGGDGCSTFNISTASAFVTAAAGGRVAKHGGRSVSSTSGSADVLEALNVNLKLNPDQVAKCIENVGFGFMFAPNHHAAMKYAAPVRKALGVRTLFNILGPLTNPAQAKNQLMGVFHPDLVGIQANVLRQLGSQRAMVVHGEDGLDEISITGNTKVAELINGEVIEYQIHPKQFGLDQADLSELQANNGDDAKRMLLSVLEGRSGVASDIVSLNAGAAIYVSGLAETLSQGVDRARAVVTSGDAGRKLQSFISYTQKISNPE